MGEQNIGKIKESIRRACSRIMGLVSDGQMQQIAIAFTFLRRVDCLISKYAEESSLFHSKYSERMSDERLDKELRRISGGYPFFNYSGYTFANILLANNSIEVVLNSYFQGFSKNLQEILDGLNYRQNVAILQRQSRFLVELLDEFSKIDLSNTSIDNKGFIELISSLLNLGIREMSSSYELSNLISDCLLSKDFRDGKDDVTTIYDPVCGTGVMLACAGEKAKRFAIYQANITLYGQEISVFPCAVAKALALLTGNEDSMVRHGNTLTEDLFPESRFQYIMADMPLALPWRPIKERIERESFDLKGRFNIGLPSVSDSQFLFIQHVISKMEPNGSRAAFITSSYVLAGGDVKSGESRIRRWMFEHDLVEAIIALPGGVLPYTNIPVFLWILNNRKDELNADRVQLIKGSFKTGKTLDVERIINAYLHPSEDEMISKFVMNNDFGFYELKLLEKGSSSKTVTIGLDTDINKYIKEEVAPFAKGEVTVDYGSVEKGYTVNFEKFFPAVIEEEEPSIDELSQKVLTLIEEFRLLETDVLSGNLQEKNLVREEPVQYDDTKQNAWQLCPLHYFAEITKGQGKQPEGGLPLLSVSYLRDKNAQSGVHVMNPSNRDKKAVADSDVLLINTGANTGEVFKGISGIASPTLTIARAHQDVVLPEFLYYLMKGNEKKLRNFAKGVSVKSIDLKTLSNAKFPLPSIEEQRQIVDKLDITVKKIDKIIDLLGGTDNVLTQYRQALIENVIQGKLKI